MSDTPSQLDLQRNSSAVNFPKWMLQASQAGKGPFSLIWDLSRRMFGKMKLQPEEYFIYGLYDDKRYSQEAKDTYVGINGPAVPSPWPEIANDKPTLTALLRGLDLPVPEIQAIAHPSRTFGGAHVLRNRDDAGRFLRTQARYPIFGKPFDSACSLGSANLTRYDAARDQLVFSSGRTTTIDSLLDQLELLGWRYQFQTLLRPHPALVPITGDRVSTVRMFVLADLEGCVLLRASWKIPAADNGADNFWRPGNMLAGIDVETGRLVKTLLRTPAGVEPIHTHPATGADFDGLVFPEWSKMRDVVLRAAPNLPGCYFQGWDVALTDRGPVLVELEGDGGDPIMEQLCFETGLWQGRYRTFVESAPDLDKRKRERAKARRNAILKTSFAQLSLPVVADAPTEIDVEDVCTSLASAECEAHEVQEEAVGAV